MAASCSCLPELARFAGETIIYISAGFMALSAIIYLTERGKKKEGEEATGSAVAKTMFMFLRDTLAIAVFVFYSVFVLFCLYLLLNFADGVILPMLIGFVDAEVAPKLASDWGFRILLLVLASVVVWLFVSGRLRTPKLIRFLTGAFSPANKFSTTVIAPLTVLSGLVFFSWGGVGSRPQLADLAAVLLLIQLLLLREIMKRDSEGKLVNHLVAAANVPPVALGLLMLDSGVLACLC